MQAFRQLFTHLSPPRFKCHPGTLCSSSSVFEPAPPIGLFVSPRSHLPEDCSSTHQESGKKVQDGAKHPKVVRERRDGLELYAQPSQPARTVDDSFSTPTSTTISLSISLVATSVSPNNHSNNHARFYFGCVHLGIHPPRPLLPNVPHSYSFTYVVRVSPPAPSPIASNRSHHLSFVR
jgi:hypothetical protein